MEGQKVRQSNFELLRIICMLLIVAHHFAVHSFFPVEAGGFGRAVIRTMIVGGKLGVNVYVLISGYFLINSQFNIRKVFKIVKDVLFYSLGIWFVMFCFGYTDLNSLNIGILLPILTKQYWFITCYLALIIFSPFINTCLKNCTQKQHAALIVALLFIQVLMPEWFETEIIGELGWFITLYIISAYLRLYSSKFFSDNRFMVPIAIISFILMVVAIVFKGLDLYSMRNIVCVLCSISLFCAFKNINIPYNRFINATAGCTLAVYLIHEHILVRFSLWNQIIKAPAHVYSNWFALYAFLSVVIVYVGCCLIEFVKCMIARFIKRQCEKYQERKVWK